MLLLFIGVGLVSWCGAMISHRTGVHPALVCGFFVGICFIQAAYVLPTRATVGDLRSRIQALEAGRQEAPSVPR
jgi:uncharacterized membrane protein (UPF0136 family)